jgi:hypothetical protein
MRFKQGIILKERVLGERAAFVQAAVGACGWSWLRRERRRVRSQACLQLQNSDYSNFALLVFDRMIISDGFTQ